ncbi:MAG: hypothetical protein A2770_02595 [Candidatus Levybacteria bacterium RIFCSPHIGHO2_01_FULL_38_12]|nr:MAG: hypothetical protein A2770_02595 [Candidatus Levybacteria bacterium RIFCSPHIGHO2_01_FULL_38_12]
MNFFSIFYLVPVLSMKTIPFGLDIGANTIKAVWLGVEKDGYVLRSAFTTSSPSRGMLSESPIDEDEMVKTIRKTITEGKITTPYVNIALPESQVYTRVIEMPVLSDKELASAIYWEAEQQIPVPLQSVTLDWTVLKRGEKGQQVGKMVVLLVGASTKLIEKYQKILTSAGLIINSIEAEVLSVIRALVTAGKFPSSLILNIGALSTSLAIVKDGIMIFTYTIPIGGMAVSRAIATDFGFDLSQADEYKKAYGVSETALGGKIGKATAPILVSILTEVKKAVTFYNEKFKNESSIRQILLSGGSARLPDIDTFFARNSGIETVVVSPWSMLKNKEGIPKEVIDRGSDYAVAIGLAMRDYE